MRTEQILKAAAKLFSKKGFYHTKMQEIADEADIGKGTVYEYFGSKEELFIQLIKEGTKKLQKLTDDQLVQEIPFWEKLQKMMETQVDFLWNNKEFTSLLMGQESRIITESELYGWLYNVRLGMLESLRNCFQQAIDEGIIAPKSPELYSKIFHGLCAQVIGGTVLLENKKPSKAELAEIIYVMRYGMGPDSHTHDIN